MNQNQVKLLWGLRACQPPPSILLAPRQCNFACSQHCLEESRPQVLRARALPLLGARRCGQWSVGGAEEAGQGGRGRCPQCAHESARPPSQACNACSPPEALPWAPGSLPSGHSFLFEELWQRRGPVCACRRQGPRVTRGQ